MDTEALENSSGFITHQDLTRTQEKLKEELSLNQKEIKEEVNKRLDKADKKMEKLDDKFTGLDDKVDQLKDLVIPLTIAMKQTAENTKEMKNFLKEFTESQTVTNGMFRDKMHGQDLAIEGLKHTTSNITDKKRYNAGIVVAAITTIGGIIVVIIQIAPNIAPLLFGR